MSQNLNLVKYFVSEFYMDKTIELAHIVSPSFYFTVNSGEPQSFDTYAHHLKLVKQNAELTISEIRSIDADNVEVDFAILSSHNGVYEKYFGTSIFNVTNGMLNNSIIKYHHSKQEFEKIQNILFGIESRQLESYFL